MGLENRRLKECPFTGVVVPQDGNNDPSPAWDCISYYGLHNDKPFPIRLDHRDKWTDDEWVVANGPAFIAKLAATGKLDSYFSEPKSIDQIRSDHSRL